MRTNTQPRRSRAAPILRDGAALAELFDFRDRAVQMRLFSDPEIFELEMERLFGRAWLALAHESEIPQPGDFVVRQMGSDKVLVVRRSPDEVNVLLNACSHRGMELERADAGTVSRFRCPYHGWIFDRDGLFVGAPCAQEMYGDNLDRPALGLKAARTEVFAGMIFATWDPEAPSLRDYLGDIAFYLELMLKRTRRGLEVVGPPQRWIIPANWKCAAEQFAGDAYHTLTLHGSLFELGTRGELTGKDPAPISGYNVSTPRGHGLLLRSMSVGYNGVRDARAAAKDALDALRKLPPHGVPRDEVGEIAELHSEGALRLLAESPPTVGQVFPNMALISTYLLSAEGGGSGPAITVRTWNPRGPSAIEVFSWTLAERSAAAPLRAHTRRTTLQAFGSSGMIEQEDAETWPSMTRVAQGFQGRQRWVRYPARSEPSKPLGWPGEGLVYSGVTRDDNQWNWWLSYYDFLAGEAW